MAPSSCLLRTLTLTILVTVTLLLQSPCRTSAACTTKLASVDVAALVAARPFIFNGETFLPGDLSTACCLTFVTCGLIDGVHRVVKGDLSDRLFSGSLPPSLGDMTALTFANFSGNLFQGPIPDNWANLKSLKTLDLSGNQLSGPLPSFIGELNLSTLVLSNNSLSGYLPSSVFTANLTKCDSYLPGNSDLHVICQNGVIRNAFSPPFLPPPITSSVSIPPPPSQASSLVWISVHKFILVMMGSLVLLFNKF